MGEKKEGYVDLIDLNPVTEKIIGCAFTVSNTLGAGFLEKVYENALALEIQKAGLKVLQQYPIHVRYDGVVVGEYFADLLVQDKVVVEIKAVKAFDEAHWAQCLNYLKATGLRLCLLLNFGKPRLEIKRIVLSRQDLKLPQMGADEHR
jgi:GxxExxY protein